MSGASVPYHCSVCFKPDDDHKWHPCQGGEWQVTQPGPSAQFLSGNSPRADWDAYLAKLTASKENPHLYMIEDAIVALRTIVSSSWVPLSRANEVDPLINAKIADAIVALGEVRDILQ